MGELPRRMQGTLAVVKGDGKEGDGKIGLRIKSALVARHLVTPPTA